MLTLSTTLFPDGLHFPSSPTPFLATIVAFLTLAILGGIAYVFQPALASYRRPVDPEPYSFPKYPTPSSSSSSSSSSSPTRRSTRTATKAQQHTQEEEEPFPTLADPPTLLLSLVIPAYNEQDRLPIMLDATLSYLHTWQTTTKKALTYELIIVDDGSTDKTAQVTQTYSQKYGSDTIRLLKLRQNRGKGGALREGMLHTRGEYTLMVDADGATDITCLEKVFERTQAVVEKEGGGVMGVGIGSRAHYEKDSVTQRAWYRTVLMRGLHVLVTILISPKIKDTQCGFKLFTRAATKALFPPLHLERWGFDLELIHMCDQMKIPMVEVPVNWREVEGSKLIVRKIDVVFASLGIFRDMLCVRLCYLLGVWGMGEGGMNGKEKKTK